MDNKEIGKRIKYARDKRAMSLQQVAELTGVARSTIQRYEQGLIGKIKLPVIESIARALNVRPDWLVGKVDTMEVSEQFNVPAEHNLKNTPLIMQYYNQLNDIGKHEATKRVEELSHVPKYINKEGIVLNAAHADDYANAPDELKQQEEDIMDSEDF